ncbi:hypothetical protein LTR05_000331 [Lithohypha guttulata]|uniref:Uncharacterized protein n=1 Tax=Lithohypha guttulata TaxID=1690604 RepID=A0AAN7T9R9_9EURO|nr:hypothetical protein LTR05_000331 [Lithohypha guttulata]
MTSRKKKTATKNPAVFKGDYSFVNKDASNIGSKDHSAAVSWHVVNRYERWKRQEQAKRLEITTSQPDVPQCASEKPEEGLKISYSLEPWQSDNAEQLMLGRSSVTTSYNLQQIDLPQPGTPNTSSYTHSEHVSIAPVPLEGVQLPPIVARILSYAYKVVVPTSWPSEMGRPKWSYEICRTWEDITALNNDSCYASATLCFYATLMAMATDDPELASQACFLQIQAMSELRERLNQRSASFEPLTIKAILRLFSAETALDNTSTARVHLKMLRNVVSSQGGTILLDPWSRANVLSADCYFALKYETRPLFPLQEWSPGSLTQPWKARLAMANIVGDHSSSVDAIIDGVLKSILLDLRELFRIDKYMNSHNVSPDDQIFRWRTLRKLDCISRLGEQQLSVKIYPHLFARPKLRYAICGGIALLTAMVLESPEPVRFGLKLTTELRHKVSEAQTEADHQTDASSESIKSNKNKVLFWLLYIGMLGERTHPLASDAIWFKSKFEDMARQLNLNTEQDQQAILKQFLWSSSLSEEIKRGQIARKEEMQRGVYESCGMSWRQPSY